jgi:DNA-binding MarR family transcriptional regulator
MSDSATPRLDEQLCFALYSASRAFSRAYAPILADLGLTYPQYAVMLVLWESDGLSVGELGERLSLDSGTLTPLLKRLEASGTIKRERDPSDERVVRIRLTAAGKKLEKKAQGVPAALACRVGATLKGSGLQKVAALRDAVREFARELEAASAPDKASPERAAPPSSRARRSGSERPARAT